MKCEHHRAVRRMTGQKGIEPMAQGLGNEGRGLYFWVIVLGRLRCWMNSQCSGARGYLGFHKTLSMPLIIAWRVLTHLIGPRASAKTDPSSKQGVELS